VPYNVFIEVDDYERNSSIVHTTDKKKNRIKNKVKK